MTAIAIPDLIVMLRRAVVVLAKAPVHSSVPPARGFRGGCATPAPVRDAEEAYGYAEAEEGRPVFTAAEIDQAQRVQGWVLDAGLDEAHRRLVWARAGRVKWVALISRFGWSERTLRREWLGSLAKVQAVANAGKYSSEKSTPLCRKNRAVLGHARERRART